MPSKGSAVAGMPLSGLASPPATSPSLRKGYGRSTQKPLQLSPSFVGSQLSEGSSTHNMPPWHVIIDGPPQGALNFCSAPLPATQVPGQSRPSLVGSHLSWGLSTHDIPLGHWMTLGPPQGSCFFPPPADFACDPDFSRSCPCMPSCASTGLLAPIVKPMLRTSSANSRAAPEKIECDFIDNSKVKRIMWGGKFFLLMLRGLFFLVDNRNIKSKKPTISLWIRACSFCAVPHRAVEVGSLCA
jgi:hypothetical protein